MSIFFRYFRSFFSRLLRPAWGTGLPAGRQGFTLVELLVVVSIVIVITSFILLRHSRFDSTTLLRSLSYSVALSLRQGQVYSTSVRGVAQGASQTYVPGYGVRLSSGEPTRYFLFADINGDRGWTQNETVATSTLGRTFTIKRFCAVRTAGTDCSDTGDITYLTIYFKRPNPDALFYTSSVGTAYTYVYIELQSAADSGVRSVKVTSTGQIAVCGLNADISTC